MKDSIIRFSLWLGLMVIVLWFGYGDTSEPQYTITPYGVKDYSVILYWQLHPTTFLDVLGWVLFGIGTFVIIGAYKLILGESLETKGTATAIYVGAAVCAALGAGMWYM